MVAFLQPEKYLLFERFNKNYPFYFLKKKKSYFFSLLFSQEENKVNLSNKVYFYGIKKNTVVSLQYAIYIRIFFYEEQAMVVKQGV